MDRANMTQVDKILWKRYNNRENHGREIIADIIDFEIKQAFTFKPYENKVNKSRIVRRRPVARS